MRKKITPHCYLSQHSKGPHEPDHSPRRYATPTPHTTHLSSVLAAVCAAHTAPTSASQKSLVLGTPQVLNGRHRQRTHVVETTWHSRNQLHTRVRAGCRLPCQPGVWPLVPPLRATHTARCISKDAAMKLDAHMPTCCSLRHILRHTLAAGVHTLASAATPPPFSLPVCGIGSGRRRSSMQHVQPSASKPCEANPSGGRLTTTQ
jgi:hypothetical protein